MAIKIWKRFEQTDGFRRAKLRVRQVLGIEPQFVVDSVCALEEYPGWHAAAGMISPDDVIYSFGICDDIGFETAVVERHGAQVFAFDPTPFSITWMSEQILPAKLKFYPWAAAGKPGSYFLYPRIKKNGQKSTVMYTFHEQEEARNDGVKVDAFCVASAAKKLGHAKVDVLKMDIEGAEYAVIDSLLKSDLRPKMLLIEFHHRFKGIGKQKTCDAIAALRAHGYQILNISITGREFCLVHATAALAN